MPSTPPTTSSSAPTTATATTFGGGTAPPTLAHAALSREQLLKAIAEVALLRGTFTLRSGKTSSYYLDKYLFSTRPELLRQLAPLFAQRLRAMEKLMGVSCQRLAGAELGGIPLVTAAGLETGLPTLFVRNQKKDYGTSKQVEGVIQPGERVVLIEDVATTGGQALEACDSLKRVGAVMLGVIATIDRQEGARENIEKTGMMFDALCTKEELGV